MNPEEITNRQIIEPYLLDPRENYPEPFYMLEYNGIPFSTIGGIQALSGQKKNGKTFVLAQLMAAVLATGCDRVNTYLPGLRVLVWCVCVHFFIFCFINAAVTFLC